MYSFRYIGCLFVSVLFSVVGILHSASLQPIDGTFQALAQSNDRVFGLDSGSILSSDDGGSTFSEIYEIVGGSDDRYFTIAALNTIVVAAGTDGLIALSSNHGSTWDGSVNSDFIQGDLKAIAARELSSPSNQQWVAAGNDGDDGVIFVSQNNGLSWVRNNSGSKFENMDFSGAVWTGSAWLVCGLKSQIAEGASDYSGVIFRSMDASTWTLIGDVYPAPLLALASDGAGEVLAVGEGGLILRSDDHGLSFDRIDQSSISEDLSSVVALETGEFMIGSDGKGVFQSSGALVSVLQPAAGGAPGVEALLLNGDTVLLGGAFVSAERMLPFDLDILKMEGFLRLSVDEAISGKVYLLESSENLESWQVVPNTSRAGSNASLMWNLPTDGTQRFWRATEF